MAEFFEALGGGGQGVFDFGLQRSGKQVLLLDKQRPSTDLAALGQSWDARIFAISPANQAFLDSLGVWPHQRNQPVRRMDVRGDSGGRIEFDVGDSGGYLNHMVENRYLLAHLWQALLEAGVVTDTQEVVGMRSDVFHTYITLADGAEIGSQLLIGADGAQSWLRHQAGIAVAAQPYHHHGVVANFATEKPHQGCAYQWFKHGEVLAYLPLPEQQISIVWSTATPEKLTQLDAEALAATVAAQGEYVLGELNARSRAFAFELVLRQPQSTVAQRLVLIGDAAHTVHPLAGQGVNLGFLDAAVLADVLLHAADRGERLADVRVLSRYERRRMPHNLALMAAMEGFERLFQSDSLTARLVRNTGLKWVNQMPEAKALFVRQALGLTGDLPPLAKAL